MQRVIEQVAGILHRNGVEFDTRAEGTQYRILLDSSATFVSFTDFGGRSVISLYSPILQEVDEADQRGAILEALNDLNAASRFGRFVYYPELRVIALEYDLLGDDLQEAELLNAVGLVAETANAQDEELKVILGTGLRYQEADSSDDEADTG
ncbi:MAG TPA: YbjN domain-containing protein [Gaiellales bacterium]|jgi:hypothetical protein